MITFLQTLSDELAATGLGKGAPSYCRRPAIGLSVGMGVVWDLLERLGPGTESDAAAEFYRLALAGRWNRIKPEIRPPCGRVGWLLAASSDPSIYASFAPLLSNWAKAAEAVQDLFDGGALFENEDALALAAAIVALEFDRLICGLSETARRFADVAKTVDACASSAREMRAKFDALTADGAGAFGLIQGLVQECLSALDPAAIVGLDDWHDTRQDWVYLRDVAVVESDDHAALWRAIGFTPQLQTTREAAAIVLRFAREAAPAMAASGPTSDSISAPSFVWEVDRDGSVALLSFSGEGATLPQRMAFECRGPAARRPEVAYIFGLPVAVEDGRAAVDFEELRACARDWSGPTLETLDFDGERRVWRMVAPVGER